MTDHSDPIEDRLRRLGGQPIDPSLASQHLTAIAAVTPSRTTTFGQRLRVGAAFAAGLLIGGTGLASAGALGPAQGVAHDALGQVGINVPDDDGNGADTSEKKARYSGPECTDAEGNPVADIKNHGQYVRSQPKGDRSEAAQSDCGKPVQSVDSGVSGESNDDAAKTDAEKQAEKDARTAEQEQRKATPPPSTVPDARPDDAGPPTTVEKPGKGSGPANDAPGHGSAPDDAGKGRGQKDGSGASTD
jgi:hypothetical protein